VITQCPVKKYCQNFFLWLFFVSILFGNVFAGYVKSNSSDINSVIHRSFSETDSLNPDYHTYAVAWKPIVDNQNPLFRYVAVGGDDGTVSLYKYDFFKRACNPSTAISTFEFSADAGAKVFDLRWDKNGEYLSVVGDHNNSGDCIAVLLCDSITHALSKADGTWSGNASDVVFAVDYNYHYGNHIAVYGYDGTNRQVKVYSFTDSALTEVTSATISSDLVDGQNATLRWRPDDNIFALSSYNSADTGQEGSVSLFEFSGSSLSAALSTVYCSAAYVHNIEWSTDGMYYFAACSDALRMYHFGVGGRSVEIFSDSTKKCHAISYTEEDNIIIGNNSTGNIETLSVNKADGILTTLDTFASDTTVYSLDATMGGRYVALGYQTDTGINEVEIFEWEVSTNNFTEVNNFDWRSSSTYLAFVGNKKSFEVSPYDRTLGTTTASVRRNISISDDAYVNAVAWTGTGAYLAVGSAPQNSDFAAVNVYTFTELGNISSDPHMSSNFGDDWEERKNAKVFEVDWSSPDVTETVTYLAALGSYANTSTQINVYEFDVDSLTYSARLSFDDTEVNAITWKPDSNYLTVGGLNISGTTDLINYRLTDAMLVETNLINLSTTDPVRALDWKPDGNYLAAGFGSHVSIRNPNLSLLSSNAEIDFNDYLDYRSVVNSLRWNPITDQLAVGVDFLEVNNLSDPGLTYDGTIYEVAWSADGKLLAVAGAPDSGDELKIYTYQDGILSFTDSVNLAADAWSVSWSHTGNYLAVGVKNSAKEVIVYEFANEILTEKDSLNLDNEAMFVRWHPERMFLLVAGYNILNTGDDWAMYELVSDSLVRRGSSNWAANSPGTKMFEWSLRRTGTANYYAFSFEDDLYIGEFNEGTDWNKTVTAASVSSIGTNINGLDWSPSGTSVALACENGTLKIYEFSGSALTLKDSVDLGTTLTAVTWSADGNYIVTGGTGPGANYEEVTIHRYDGNSADLILTESADYGDFVYSVAWNKDDDTIAVGGYSPNRGSGLKIFNYRRTIVEEEVNARIEFGQEVRTSAWSKDGNLFAIAGLDEDMDKKLQIYAFDGSQLTLTYQLENAFDEIYSLDWSYTGNYLAVGANQSADKELIVYKYEDDILQLKDSADLAADVVSVNWQPDSSVLTAFGTNISGIYELLFYDFSNENLDTILSHQNWWSSGIPVQVAWDPSGRYLFIIKDTRLYIGDYSGGWYDVGLPPLYNIATDENTHINSAAWSPCGGYIVTGAIDGTVKIYLNTGAALTLKDSADIGTEVYSVDWIGNFIVAGGDPTDDNKQVQVYEFDPLTETISLLEQSQKDFNGIVNKVEWHPGGDYMSVVGTGTPDVQVYDFNGSVLSEITDSQISFTHATSAHFDISSDGNYLAVVHYLLGGGNSDKQLSLYDVSNIDNGVVTYLHGTAFVYPSWGVAWSPNSKYVAVTADNGHGDSRIYVYKLVGNQLSQIAVRDINDDTPSGILTPYEVKWSPDGKYLMIALRGEDSGRGVAWYRFNGTSVSYLGSLDVGDGSVTVYAIDWSPSGDYLALCGGGLAASDFQIYSFDKSTLILSAVDADEIDQSSNGLHWNPDGKYLAVGYFGDNTARLYYFNGTSLVLKDQIDIGIDVPDVRWDPSGQFLIVAQEDDFSRCTYSVYEFNRVNETLDFIPDAQITDYGAANSFDYTDMRWFPNGDKFVIMGRAENNLQFFNFAGMPLQQKSEMNVNYGTEAVTTKWHPSGNYLAVGGNGPTDENETHVYKFDANHTLSLLPGGSVNYGSAVYGMAWNSDGSLLAVGGVGSALANEIQVYRFNGQSSLCVTTSANYGTSVYSLAWSKDNNYLAVGGEDPTNGNELQIFSVDTADHLEDICYRAGVNLGESSIVRAVDWSPDGNYLAIAGSSLTDGEELRIYSFDSPALTYEDGADFGSAPYDVSWAPSGKYVAIVGDGGSKLQIYPFESGSLGSVVVNESLGADIIYSVTWSPCGHYLMIGNASPTDNYESQAYYFDGSSVTLAGSVDYGGASSYVRGVDWSSDGKFIAAVGKNPTDGKEVKVYAVDWQHKETGDIKICDFDSTAQTLVITGTHSYSGVVKSVDWSAGGRYIASAGTLDTGLDVFETTTGSLCLDQINTVAWYPKSWGGADSVITSSIVYGGRGRSVRIDSYDESTTTFTNGRNISLMESAQIHSLAWTSTGKFLAVGSQPANGDFGVLSIFRFDADGGLTSILADEGICDYDWTMRTSAQVYDVSWKVNTNPETDEMYLVVVGDFLSSATQVAVYQFDGTTLTQKDTQDFADKTVNAVAWRPEQNEFAVGGLSVDGTNDVIIYPFDGSSISAAAHTMDKNTTVKSLDWTHDGNYLAVGAGTTLYIVDDSLTDVDSIDCGLTINDVKWDKNYRIVIGLSSGSGNEIRTYYLDGTNLTEITAAGSAYTGDVKSVDWSGGGKRWVVGGTENNTLHFGSTTYSTSTDISVSSMYAMDVNPAGDRLVIGGNAKAFELQDISGKSTTSLNNVNVGYSRTMNVLSFAWSCTGKYVAVGAQPMVGECDSLYIYSYDSTELELTSVTSTFCGASWESLYDGGGIVDVSWNSPTHPSRSTSTMYLAVVGDCVHSSTGVIVFEFDSSELIEKVTVDFGNNSVGAVSWKPQTDYIVVGGNNISSTSDVVIYEFTGSSLSPTYVRNLSTSDVVRALDWSPSKTYIAVRSGNNLFVLNSDLTKIDGESDVSASCGAQINSLKWSSDGNYIIVGCNGSAGNEVQVYSFDGADKTLTNIDSINYGTDDVHAVGWSSNSEYKHYGGSGGGSLNFQDVRYGNLAGSDFQKTDWTLNNKDVMEGAAYVRDTLFLGNNAHTYFSLHDGAVNNIVSVDSRMTLSEDLIVSGTLRDTDTTLSFSGDGHTMYFLKDQTLSDLKITASDIVIDAQGHTLNLNGTRVIRSCGATSGSTVHIKNCTCSISSPEALYMEDSTSSFIFENCVFDLSSNCSIDTGAIEFRGNVVITGDGYSFILGGYSHTIASNSNVCVDSGVSFCVTPTRSDGTFLNFSDDTSLLTLCDATLNIYQDIQSDISGNNVILEGDCSINAVYYGDTYNPLSAITSGNIEFENAVIDVKENLNLSNMSLRLK
jgi:WD40 repeat protein